jgi:hypothetical protein
MRQPFLLILSVLITISAYPQNYTVKEPKWWLQLDAGYLRQGAQHRIEGNVGFCRIASRYGGTDSTQYKIADISWGPFIGLSGYVNDRNILRCGQQIGFSVVYNYNNVVPIGFKASAFLENYTAEDLRVSFAGGPLLAGFIHCQYGYSIPLGKQTIEGIGRHRLGVLLYLSGAKFLEFIEDFPGHR